MDHLDFASLSKEELIKRLKISQDEIVKRDKLDRPCTMLELLKECYDHIDKTFRVETEPRWSTRGSLTSVKGKKCPTMLKPWIDFPDQQSNAFQKVTKKLDSLGKSLRLFSSTKFIRELGSKQAVRTIASEEDLRYFQHQFVEDYVASICSRVTPTIKFSNHSHILAEDSEDSDDALGPPQQGQLRARALPRTPKPAGADQICVLKPEQGKQRLLYLIEYKAPHKLTKDSLRACLGWDTSNGEPVAPKPIVVSTVRNQETRPTETKARFHSLALELTAAASTQAYHYMLESGCAYGCVVTGESFVFLTIEEDEPNVLYYHLAEPLREAISGPSGKFLHSQTAIAQLTSFCLVATEVGKRSQEWIAKAMDAADIWQIDDQEMWEETPRKMRELDLKDVSFRAPKSAIKAPTKSTVTTRSKSHKQCKPEAGDQHHSDDYDSDDEQDSDEEPLPTPTRAAPVKGSQVQQEMRGKHTASSAKQQQRQYCTQACLLGLVRRLPIDSDCPNAEHHPRSKTGDTHALTKSGLRNLLRQQLAHTRDEDCENLEVNGARGLLFKLCLATHGYTLVGKGTVARFIPHIQHEGKMYNRLRKLQGWLIPVCFGNIDLEIPWYDLGIHIVHMLLLSYGGEEPLDSSEVQRQQTVDFQSTIEAFGVRHGDVGCRNMLWNEELRRLMFIDFERSTLMDPIQKVPKDNALWSNPRKPSRIKAPSTRIRRRETGKRKVLGELPLSYSKLNRSGAVQRDHTADNSVATSNDKNRVRAKEHQEKDRLEMPIDSDAAAH
ncbi:MAG: hypothetical protein Q9178_007973 [Gyalolechia marmorata]